jgi:L-lactate dehydrogenase (cytochrome)
MDAVRIIPRYGVDLAEIDTEIELFGQKYAQPVGVGAMGNIGMVWPGMDAILAKAAQKARIPYTSSTVANVGMERLAELAPDVFWFQLYGIPKNDHAESFDLIARAAAVGAKALLVTLDVPLRQKRVHDIRNGLSLPFKYTPRTVFEIATHPVWASEILRLGVPHFPNLIKYAGSAAATGPYAQANMTTGVTWEHIARFRDAFPRALVVKGIQHPEDAKRAVELGCDGILVSNHGGRQFDAAPASIDSIPAIKEAVGDRAKILFDGSIRSGLDVLRALAVGADVALAGRAFLYAVAALGEEGGDHAAFAFTEEIRGTFAQAGLRNVAEAQACPVLHPNAVDPPRDRANARRGMGRAE